MASPQGRSLGLREDELPSRTRGRAWVDRDGGTMIAEVFFWLIKGVLVLFNAFKQPEVGKKRNTSGPDVEIPWWNQINGMV